MNLNEYSQVAQIIGTVAIVVTLIFYWWQLRAMQDQVKAAREASRTQNILALIDYIQRPEHRAARRALFALKERPFVDWNKEEKREAEMACSAWDTVGLVLKNTDLPQAQKMIVGNWRHSIFLCHALTIDLKSQLRRERDEYFWDDLDWLAVLALEGQRIEGTALRSVKFNSAGHDAQMGIFTS